MVMQGTYDPSFDLSLHCKDNQLCFEIARKHKVMEFHVSKSKNSLVKTQAYKCVKYER
jgi:3-hydroxyisobutyrate dehydrogenase-like beta-hydroxyacid dehydrogenase